jgi:hypothetical protein
MRKMNMFCFLALLAFGFIAVQAGAGEFKQWLKTADGEHYQQPGFCLSDPKGDAFLIRKLDQIPLKLLQTLVKGSYPQAEIEKEKELQEFERRQLELGGGSEKYRIGRTHPIQVERLINMIRQVIQSYPAITPHLGEEHEWSPEAKKYLLYGFWHRVGRFALRKQKEFPSPLFLRSKLFLLLACGFTSRYAMTGQEAALEARLMQYPDRSVSIHHLFMESYVLNKGNMYLTMLTAENLLAGDPYRANRGDSPLQQKLRYIRNDTLEMGDNYGAWYHFFGIGMYGMMRSALAARSVAEIESLGSIFLEGFDRQEDFINRLGAIFGRRLRRMLDRKEYLTPVTAKDRTDYLLKTTPAR